MAAKSACRCCQNEHETMNGKTEPQIMGYGKKGVKNHLPPLISLFDDMYCRYKINLSIYELFTLLGRSGIK